MNLGSLHRGTQASRLLRKYSTLAERRLWALLRNRRLGGHKFRRQVNIGPHIVDFCCLQAKIIVELDGGQHEETRLADAKRDDFLRNQGYRVMRFWNEEVFSDSAKVSEAILRGTAEV